jgi:NADH dehydrogenase
MLRRTQLLCGQVTSVSVEARTAAATDIDGVDHLIIYRTLVLAPGSVPTVLPVPGLVENAVGFKSLADAIWLRNRVLRQLEAADAIDDLQRRRELLTVTFVGGGYAGVEALAELESLATDALRLYPRLSRSDFRWVLVEAQETLLPGLNPRLARYVQANLERRDVEVRLSTRLSSCEGKVVRLSDSSVAPYLSETIVWTTGQRPSPLVAELGLPLDERGRLRVGVDLRVVDHPDVFALGDAAAVPDREGGTSPGTAQHAVRQAATCARNVAASLGYGSPARFDHRNLGLAVTLGRGAGVAEIRRLLVRGRLAWWMGRSYHLLATPGLARKARLVADWTLALFFRRDVAQLGDLGRPTPLGG